MKEAIKNNSSKINSYLWLKWVPVITFLLIIPCGIDTLCIPFLLAIPLGLAAGDSSGVGVLALVGINLIVYSNLRYSNKNEILFLIGNLILLSTVLKGMYDSGNSYPYVWKSNITYFTLILFFVSSLVIGFIFSVSEIRNSVDK